VIGTRSHAVYEFGLFDLDPAERLLLREGLPLTLPPKTFDLLVYFVEHPNRLLGKSELMGALWPDSFVEEANLSYQVSLLRRTLDSVPPGGPLIQTVPKIGYRFIANVTQPTRADARVHAPEWDPAPARTHQPAGRLVTLWQAMIGLFAP
jgi:DNA-binding winged helix-turn-helix (wHTH) protein